ncbi:MAG: ribonuclease III [Pseudomonadota bacterium]
MDERAAIEGILGHRFADPELLDAALAHSSLGRRGPAANSGAAFERLEFLGDRVLGLVIAQLLFEAFPGEAEGGLARRHAVLVSRETLARVARAIELGRYLKVAKSEAGRRTPAVLADALEAVVAALALDGGLAPARAFIARHFEPLLSAAFAPPSDAKTALQEWAQGRGKPLPVYRTLKTEGPAHRPRFAVEAIIEGLAPEIAHGPSKRAAERAAAAALLRRATGALE